jgi:uncharacterized protein
VQDVRIRRCFRTSSAAKSWFARIRLWRLDEEYKNLHWEVKSNVTIKPSEYFRRQCYVSIEPSEPNLDRVIESIGSDNFIFCSDYPDMDCQPDIVKEVVDLEKTLSSKTVAKIVWDNPNRFYGLNR